MLTFVWPKQDTTRVTILNVLDFVWEFHPGGVLFSISVITVVANKIETPMRRN